MVSVIFLAQVDLRTVKPKRGGVLARALSFCAKITFLFMKEVEAMTLIGCALILLGVVLLIRGDNNN